MLQTREHLAILDLLQTQKCIAVITKSDLANNDWLGLGKADVEELLKSTTLKGSPIISVSSTTGNGLPELVSTIDQSLKNTPTRKGLGRPRLPIDRSFTISGFGTVVTGTLMDGTLKLGQPVELAISGSPPAYGGLETHKQKVEEAFPCSRVAANLSCVFHDEIKRGEVLTIPGWARPTDVIDVRLKIVPDISRPLKHNSFVTLHIGTSETTARVRLLESDAAGQGLSAWAQLKITDHLVMVKGDFFVIRLAEATLGGGAVIDTQPKRHRRGHTPVLEQVADMQKGSSQDVLLNTLDSAQPVSFKDLVKRASLSEAKAGGELSWLTSEKLAVVLGKIDGDTLIFSAVGWYNLSSKANSALADYHRQFPLRKRCPKKSFEVVFKSQPRTTHRYCICCRNREVWSGKVPSLGLPTTALK